ncbi:hypothetical protein Bca4012_063197 [Brassica carinata]
MQDTCGFACVIISCSDVTAGSESRSQKPCGAKTVYDSYPNFTKSLKQKKEKQAKREQWTGCHSGEVLSSSSHERTGQVSDLVKSTLFFPNWSRRTKLAILQIGRERPSLLYGELVETDRTCRMANWLGQSEFWPPLGVKFGEVEMGIVQVIDIYNRLS